MSAPDIDTRYGVAQNPACPPELLTVLAADSESAVRAVAASHRDCPPETLAMLSRHDPDGYVRACADDNPSRRRAI